MTTNDDDDFMIINGKQVLKDGRTLRVGMTFMDNKTVADNAMHRPGHRTTDAKVNDDARHLAYAGMVHDVSTAWQRPGEAVEIATDKKPPADASDKAYSAMVAGLTDAWRAA